MDQGKGGTGEKAVRCWDKGGGAEHARPDRQGDTRQEGVILEENYCIKRKGSRYRPEQCTSFHVPSQKIKA